MKSTSRILNTLLCLSLATALACGSDGDLTDAPEPKKPVPGSGGTGGEGGSGGIGGMGGGGGEDPGTGGVGGEGGIPATGGSGGADPGTGGSGGVGGQGGEPEPVDDTPRLRWRLPPADAPALQPLGRLEVEVVDPRGERRSDLSGDVTIAIAAGPAQAKLAGSTSAPLLQGLAVFEDLSLDRAGTYSLLASSEDLEPVLSPPFRIGAGGPAHLVFQAGPYNTRALEAMYPALEVVVLDEVGNLIADASGTVVLEAAEGSPEGAMLLNAEAEIEEGVARFYDLRFDRAGTYMLVARLGALTSLPSRDFEVRPGPADRLVFTEAPPVHEAGETFGVALEVHDAAGNLVPGARTVELRLEGGVPGAELLGRTDKEGVGGRVDFDGLRIERAGQNYRLIASSPELDDAESPAFHVLPGAAAAIAYLDQPRSAKSGDNVGPVVVEVQDAWGNPIAAHADPVKLALSPSAPPDATIVGATETFPTAGRASFESLQISRAAKGYQLLVTSDALGPFASSYFDVSAGDPHRLVFSTSPKNGYVNNPLTESVVDILDVAGNRTDSTLPVRVELQGGEAGATLGGTTLRDAVAGRATFTDLSIDTEGGPYTLRATSGSLFAATSASFSIVDPDGAVCPEGYTKCDGACVDLTNNNAHCGRCNNSCDGFACEDSTCQLVCPEGMELCDGTCVDKQTDASHCGACNQACGEEEICLQGSCGETPDREWALWRLPPDNPTNYISTEEMVEDTFTGLIWQRKVMTNASFNWAAANDYCRNLRLAGRDDWRLPTVIELLSIVDTSVSSPAINRGAFPGTPNATFWTATVVEGSPTRSWYVAFSSGSTSNQAQSSTYAVRCVRGGKFPSASSRYLVDEETATDLETGLVWQVTAPTTDRTWSDAHDYCASLDLGGHQDWRLPTKKELESLIDRRSGSPTLDETVFPGVGSWYYWTASGNPMGSTGSAWRVYFNNGTSSTASTGGTSPGRYKVRCVRDDFPPEAACAPGQSTCGGVCVDFQSDPLHCGACNITCAKGQVCHTGVCISEPDYDWANWPLPPERPDDYVLNEETVIDLVTGLEWERENIGASLSWSDADAYCKALGAGGHTDWRMPSVAELLTLVDSGASNPSIHTEAFPNTPADNFWSSTPRANPGYPGYAWYVSFSNGGTGTATQTTAYRIRCVRRGSANPAPRYDIGEETVRDRRTGLIWQRKGLAAAFRVEDAAAYCSTLGAGGYTDWRLPTKKELESLVDRRVLDSSIYSTAFLGQANSYYWTSTPVSGSSTNTWRVYFTEGVSSSGTSTSSYYVRCVRTPDPNPVACGSLTACGEICADLTSDPSHCGACNSPCGPDQVCQGSVCTAPPDREWANWPLPPESPSQYLVKGDTIEDTVTGLVWQRRMIASGAFTWDAAHEYCATMKLEGYADWRLPTAIELLSLVDSDRTNPSLHTDFFEGNPNGNLWSATRRASNPSYAWYVSFSRGATGTSTMTTTYPVRCVRGGKLPTTSRYHEDDGLVRDLETGLLWQQEALGATFFHADAESYCSTLGLGGYTDWRLPTKKELESLVSRRDASPSIHPIFGGPASYYWTSTPYDASNVWHVYFTDGVSGSSAISGTSPSRRNVRCVRELTPPPVACAGSQVVCGDVCVDRDSDPSHCGQCHLACGEDAICEAGSCVPTPDYEWASWPLPDESPRFQDYTLTDQTVRDSVTGLVWQRQMMTGALFSWEQAMAYCRDLKLEGYADWRLPSVAELLTIVNTSATNPAITHTAFEGTAHADHWSSTLRADNPGYAWAVHFGTGAAATATIGTGKAARCVRGGGAASGPQYQAEGDVVRDLGTGLIWQREVLPSTFHFSDAELYCASLGAGGYDDWRLPTKKELESLVLRGSTAPAIDTTRFPGIGNWAFWSSTPHATTSTSIWGVNFQYGNTSTYSTTGTSPSRLYVRCVRDPAPAPTTCPGSQSVCGDVCVDRSSDPAHCGTCGNACEEGEICGSGSCRPAPDTDWARWPLPPARPIQYTLTPETVHDAVTGLTWQRNVIPNATFNWTVAQAYCRSLKIEGYADWRLPSMVELLSLVDETRRSPALNITAFDTAPTSGNYWSSTPYAGSSSQAWLLSGSNGASTTGSQSSAALVRCVRGGPPGNALAFQAAGDEVVDPNTGLVWQREPGRTGSNWTDAEFFCNAIGWRLPTKKELESLVNRGRTNPAFDNEEAGDGYPVFSGGNANTWTSSEQDNNPDNAWYVSFSTGVSNTAAKTSSYAVRCVKDLTPGP